MSQMRQLMLLGTLAIGLLTGACGNGARQDEHGEREGHGEHGGREGRGEHGGREGRGEHGGREGRGEHGGREGGHAGEEGEESGTLYASSAACDETRKGTRLRLKYDAGADAFVGTVHNTSDKVLEQVRVEVHLSGGPELGPTPAADLAPGAIRKILLPTKGNRVERWSAHAEVGRGEHGHREGGEHRGGR